MTSSAETQPEPRVTRFIHLSLLKLYSFKKPCARREAETGWLRRKSRANGVPQEFLMRRQGPSRDLSKQTDLCLSQSYILYILLFAFLQLSSGLHAIGRSVRPLRLASPPPRLSLQRE